MLASQRDANHNSMQLIQFACVEHAKNSEYILFLQSIYI